MYYEQDHYELHFLMETLESFFTLIINEDTMSHSLEQGTCDAVIWCVPESRALHHLIAECALRDIPLFIVRPYRELEVFKVMERHYKNVYALAVHTVKKRGEVHGIVKRICRWGVKREHARSQILKFTLRLPQQLDEKISLKAKEEGTTKASLVRTILETSLSGT